MLLSFVVLKSNQDFSNDKEIKIYLSKEIKNIAGWCIPALSSTALIGNS